MKKTGLAFSLVLFLSVSIQTNAQWFWQNPLPQGNTLGSISLLNENSALVLGSNGALISTQDYGDSWSNIDLPAFVPSEIYFANENVGYIAGFFGTILKTIDAGDTWTEISVADSIYLRSTYFISPDTGFCVGDNGVIIKTTDGGNSWEFTESGTSEV